MQRREEGGERRKQSPPSSLFQQSQSQQQQEQRKSPVSDRVAKKKTPKQKGKKTLSSILQQFQLSEGEEGDLDLFYQEGRGASSYSEHQSEGYNPSHVHDDDGDEEQMLLYNEQQSEKRKKKKKKKKKRELLLSSSSGYEHLREEDV